MNNIHDIIPQLKHRNSNNFFLIAGPCVVESDELCFKIAENILKITNKLKIPYIFKASYKKANRSRLDSFTGIGDKKALEILKEIGKKYDIPVITDIHSVEEAYFASRYVDVLQIPAFLCRQTELLIAAGKTGKVINVKKGQFLAPESMSFVADKIKSVGNKKIILTDRGTMFGYQDLIVDFRGLVTMKKTGHPVVIDVTHSLQQPNQSSGVAGGKPECIETLCRAGISVGIDGIFMETHPDPANARSDGKNMLHLDLLENLLEKLVKIRKTIIKL